MNFMPVFLWSDRLVFLLLVAGVVWAMYVRRHEHLLLPWRRVAQSATAMVSLLVLSLFLFVGMLDTLHYQVALPDKNGGETVYSPEVLSVFDKLLTPLRTHRENIFSTVGSDVVRKGKYHRREWHGVSGLSAFALWRRASGECAAA